MIGDHHIQNCLMAAAVGLAEGIDLPTIVRGLENVTRVPGRLEAASNAASRSACTWTMPIRPMPWRYRSTR